MTADRWFALNLTAQDVEFLRVLQDLRNMIPYEKGQLVVTATDRRLLRSFRIAV